MLVTIEAQQNCTVLHFLLVVIPCFLLITPLLQGHMFFNSSKKNISKSRVLWSEGSGTCPPVKVPPPKGVVVISISDCLSVVLFWLVEGAYASVILHCEYMIYISYLVWTRPGEELFRATRRIRRHLSSLSNRTLVLLAVLLARSLAPMSHDVTWCHMMSHLGVLGQWTWQLNRHKSTNKLRKFALYVYQVLIGQSNVYWRSTARRFVNHIEWHGCTRTIWWWYFMPMAGEASWACAEPDLDRKEKWTKVSKLWNNLKQFPMINLLELVSCLIMFAFRLSVRDVELLKSINGQLMKAVEQLDPAVWRIFNKSGLWGESVQNGRCIPVSQSIQKDDFHVCRSRVAPAWTLLRLLHCHAGREVFDDGVPLLRAPWCAWTVVATAGPTNQRARGLVGSCGHGVDAWQKLSKDGMMEWWWNDSEAAEALRFGDADGWALGWADCVRGVLMWSKDCSWLWEGTIRFCLRLRLKWRCRDRQLFFSHSAVFFLQVAIRALAALPQVAQRDQESSAC